MKYFLFFIISISLLFSCSKTELSEESQQIEITGYIRILEGEKAIDYFSKYIDLSEEQNAQIITIASEFQNDLQNMDVENRSKNQARYTIKFVSKIIRDVMTMEQAEKYIKEDPAANELFSETKKE